MTESEIDKMERLFQYQTQVDTEECLLGWKLSEASKAEMRKNMGVEDAWAWYEDAVSADFDYDSVSESNVDDLADLACGGCIVFGAVIAIGLGIVMLMWSLW